MLVIEEIFWVLKTNERSLITKTKGWIVDEDDSYDDLLVNLALMV